MKKYKKIIAFVLFILVIGYIVKILYKERTHKKDPVVVGIATEAQLKKIEYVFDDGCSEVALITMVKNEDDIIFENLVWHFSLGFRKFIVIDNLSTDRTRDKVKEFVNLTKDHAAVFVIEDPVFEYIQSRITTGAYDFARSVWPDVKWIFPVDADEFWITERKISDIITNIPKDIDAISVMGTRYYASDDYDTFPQQAKFYEKLHYRTDKVPLNEKSLQAKVAVRARDNIVIAQGNHSIIKTNKCTSNDIKYIDGKIIGLDMYEYPIRSVEHTHRKLLNGMKVNQLGKNLGLICEKCGSHWDQYSEYLEKNNENAASVKFRETFISSKYSLDDHLPIDEVLESFYEKFNK